MSVSELGRQRDWLGAPGTWAARKRGPEAPCNGPVAEPHRESAWRGFPLSAVLESFPFKELSFYIADLQWVSSVAASRFENL